MQSTADTIRPADTADVPTLTRTLVRAYIDDPVAMWICDSSPLRAKLLTGLYSARVQQLLSYGAVWTNPQRTSAAVWIPPGCHEGSIRPNATVLRCLSHPRMLARLPLLAVGFAGMQRKHPHSPPHWYLSLVGTDPGARGLGLGSAVLQPVLDRCDSEGVGIYLESSKPRNIGFYERLGFRTTGELQLPGGPKMWPMWREPSEAQA